MAHLIKRYSCILSEIIHTELFFLNSTFSFPYLSHLTQQYFYPVFPVHYKNQQDKSFCWFFFASKHIKTHIK
jgi:hypothetical protein